MGTRTPLYLNQTTFSGLPGSDLASRYGIY
jgi:hypothetical protein